MYLQTFKNNNNGTAEQGCRLYFALNGIVASFAMFDVMPYCHGAWYGKLPEAMGISDWWLTLHHIIITNK